MELDDQAPCGPQWEAERLSGKRIAKEPDGEQPSRNIRISDLLMVAAEVQAEDKGDERALVGTENDDEHIQIPPTYQEAVRDPVFGTRWKEATQRELQSLIKFGTWEIVQREDAGGCGREQNGYSQ